MNRERLKILARLLKEEAITEDEFVLLSEKEIVYQYYPSFPATSPWITYGPAPVEVYSNICNDLSVDYSFNPDGCIAKN